MTFQLSEMPYEGYWRYLKEHGKPGVQLFGFPLATVLAESTEEATAVATEAMAWDGWAYCEAAMDSAEASNRLGLWGRPDLAKIMERGD